MLERFTVPGENQVLVSETALRTTVTQIFESMGEPPEDAALAADVLVTADLRGVETHGVSNMLRAYVSQYQSGRLQPDASWVIERETPAIAVIDGMAGHGIIQGPKAMQIAIDKASQVGVGIVVVRNSGHLGPIGHHAMLAAEQDMVGICKAAAGLWVLPTFGAEKRLGTNPLAIAAPARDMPPVLFDVATSAVAGNKIGLAQRVGASLEPGWVAAQDGTPIMEEVAVPPGQPNLLPLGGTREQGSHKGYGLALMVEIMATMLSGGLPGMLLKDSPPRHYLAAYDIKAFTDLERFKDSMDEMLTTLVETPPAPRYDRVIYPGVSEYEQMIERRANGIPLHVEVIEWFNSATDELNLERLETMSAD